MYLTRVFLFTLFSKIFHLKDDEHHYGERNLGRGKIHNYPRLAQIPQDIERPDMKKARAGFEPVALALVSGPLVIASRRPQKHARFITKTCGREIGRKLCRIILNRHGTRGVGAFNCSQP